MSGISEKEKMRDALLITEGNLNSLIGIRYNAGITEQSDVIVNAMTKWREVVRRALGSINESHECICYNCGIRHGGKRDRDATF